MPPVKSTRANNVKFNQSHVKIAEIVLATKEHRQNFGIFWIFPAHVKNGPRWPQMGPGGFFPTNPDLADILVGTDLDFIFLYFGFFGTILNLSNPFSVQPACGMQR